MMTWAESRSLISLSYPGIPFTTFIKGELNNYIQFLLNIYHKFFLYHMFANSWSKKSYYTIGDTCGNIWIKKVQKNNLIMLCQCRLIDCNKRATLLWDSEWAGELVLQWGQKIHMSTLYFLFNFLWTQNFLKNKAYLLKICIQSSDNNKKLKPKGKSRGLLISVPGSFSVYRVTRNRIWQQSR